MSVQSVCLGWHWEPYAYSRTADDTDGAPVKPLPREIADLARAGTTVFLTTHILQEAEELCSTIALIDRGRIVAQGDLSTITSMVSDVIDVSISFRTLSEELYQAFGALPILRLSRHHASVQFSLPGNRLDLLEALGRLAVAHQATGMEMHGTSLEDAYVELLGGGTARRGDGSTGPRTEGGPGA